jgi:hypothetical protein
MVDTQSGEIILGAMDDIMPYVNMGGDGMNANLPLPASFVEVSHTICSKEWFTLAKSSKVLPSLIQDLGSAA